MENRLLNQFNNVIKPQWFFKQIEEPYETLTRRELFELAYHTCNSVSTRNIFIRLASSEDQDGSKAIMYSNTKKFTSIEAIDSFLKVTKYFSEESTGDKITTEIQPLLKKRKEFYTSKDTELKKQILKSILVERKLDECINLVLLKSINRKVYFAIGDARESAAVVPLFMKAEGASLVQLALNKWMETAQRLEQEQTFPDKLVPGILKNITQIKRWLIDLISSKLDG